VWESKVSEEWQIIFYRDSDGTEPVQEFLLDPSLTSGELKQFQVRVMLLTQKGLSLLLERSDILDKIKGEKNLYELRLDNTPNNPRIFLCALVGKRLILLHAFKKKGHKTPKLEIKIAVKRRDMVLANEEDRKEDEK
jgi:phage-related protein